MEFNLPVLFLMLLVGIVLGMVGGGGGTLLMPIFVYWMGINVVTATSYSLFIIGVTSTVGAINFAQKKLVNFRTAFIFAVPSLITVYLVRRFLLPSMPDSVLFFGSAFITKHLFIMMLFAFVLILSSYNMISGRNYDIGRDEGDKTGVNYPMVFISGIIVGLLSGLVGAGGGFLILPTLLMFTKLPIRLTIGTSITIIAVNSCFGFLTDLIHSNLLEWEFLMYCSVVAIIGMFVGSYTGNFISGVKLKKIFGYVTLIVGIVIIVKEILV
jgi:uncharacterized membrane protein YfcA